MPARKKQPEGPPVILLVTNAAWQDLRVQFSESEKETLRRAVVNQVICPPGVYLDVNRLPAELREKLSEALAARAERNLTSERGSGGGKKKPDSLTPRSRA